MTDEDEGEMTQCLGRSCLLHVRAPHKDLAESGLCDGTTRADRPETSVLAPAHISYHSRHVKRSPSEGPRTPTATRLAQHGHDSKQISSLNAWQAQLVAAVRGTQCPRERELIRDKKRRPGPPAISLRRFLVLVVSQRKIKRTKGLSE